MSPSDLDFVRRTLLDSEWELWSRLDLSDQRHSVIVARRFTALVPESDPAEVSAALLHDVGKSVSTLSTTARVVATVLEPLCRLRRFEAYYRHEEIGLDLCRAAGSRERTLRLLSDPGDPLAHALRRADHV
ncbi:MAG: hypothetical protein RLZ86_148 [Actinomycetota bacterium]|jgi:hypothetical protein